MKYENRERIIDILKWHSELIGTDPQELKTLVSEMMQIQTHAISLSLEEEIHIQMATFCAALDYEPTPENNHCRDKDLIVKRDVISKMIVDQYFAYPRLPHVISEFFGKDRSTGNNMVSRCKIRHETKEILFMYHYNRLVVSEFIAA